MHWNPEKYREYLDERSRPFGDLVARVNVTSPRRVVDLGCGPGQLTALLAARWPDAVVEGIDSSPEMISAAGSVKGVRFRIGDIRAWEPTGNTDVVISNAALQWVPDHVPLLRSWAAALASGGWLAWQVPANFDAPSHTLLRSLAESARWNAALDGVLRHHDAARPTAEYAALLLDAGLHADVWETTYLHVLAGRDPVLEWMRGTGLRPVLAALSPEEASRFEAAYAQLLREAYPATHGGTVFPFRRVFCVGHKP